MGKDEDLVFKEIKQSFIGDLNLNLCIYEQRSTIGGQHDNVCILGRWEKTEQLILTKGSKMP